MEKLGLRQGFGAGQGGRRWRDVMICFLFCSVVCSSRDLTAFQGSFSAASKRWGRSGDMGAEPTHRARCSISSALDSRTIRRLV